MNHSANPRGIERIGVHVPEGRVSNYARAKEFELTDAFIEQKLGVASTSRMAEGEDTSDLAVRAVQALAAKQDLDLPSLDALVVCTQNPDGRGLPHTSAIVHARLGCSDRCAAFDLGLGCSGFVYGVSVLRAFLDANGLERGLLITADPYSKILRDDDRSTTLLFGDAAAATLISTRPRYALRRARFGTRGSEGDALRNVDGRLEMNGRAVFEFAMRVVPGEVGAVLAEAGLDLGDVDRFLFHQGSRYIVDNLRRRLKIDEARVPLLMREFGNTVSSTLPILLEQLVDEHVDERIILSGFGVGLSWATALIERIPAEETS